MFFSLPLKGLISVFFDFAMDLIENEGASPIRTSVASFPAGGFFFVNVTLAKKHENSCFFNDFS